jgi:NAD+ kinase
MHLVGPRRRCRQSRFCQGFVTAAPALRRLHSVVDFVVCLGGDGVLLHASMLFKHAIPPVISFHLGSLGFLTNHDFRHFRADLANVIYGCEDLDECSLPEEEMKV